MNDDAASKRWQMHEDEDIWLGQLARAAQEGNDAARDVLWSRVERHLMRIAMRAAYALEMTDRDDVAQETFPLFATLLTDWSGPGPGGTGFATYLFGLFRWRLHTILRTARRRQSIFIAIECLQAEDHLHAISPAALATVAWHEYGVDLSAFLAALPRQEREIFLLRVHEGLDAAEAGARLGLTPHSVRRYWNATLRRLRATMQGESAPSP